MRAIGKAYDEAAAERRSPKRTKSRSPGKSREATKSRFRDKLLKTVKYDSASCQFVQKSKDSVGFASSEASGLSLSFDTSYSLGKGSTELQWVDHKRVAEKGLEHKILATPKLPKPLVKVASRLLLTSFFK